MKINFRTAVSQLKAKMNKSLSFFALVVLLVCQFLFSDCGTENKPVVVNSKSARDILGNPEYLAISYGGYRHKTRSVQPTLGELKEDLQILHAMNIRLLRTYNVHFAQASNLLKAIHELKIEDPSFEMYVMLGAWINCNGAFTANPDHTLEDRKANETEIDLAVGLAKEYTDIVKIIAVGNEAMVKWATSYFVQPAVILKYVNYLQDLKSKGDLPADLWITSSDNFASWGGGGAEYHVDDLNKLIEAVDFISMHTYPMHDTHYNPDFWGTSSGERELSEKEKIHLAMNRAYNYARKQYNSTLSYMMSRGVSKPIHIGETGWASFSNYLYGTEGSKATDEYKQGIYYKQLRKWTDTAGITCFFFEAFDEVWKDANNPGGSENHFGIFDLQGRAKYAIWEEVDKGYFKGLSRGGNSIKKTFNGDLESLMRTVHLAPENEKLLPNEDDMTLISKLMRR